jgi:glycosyltransferase involved in cell wall biosynthesis
MPRVVHIVTTANFAGVERYVCDVATETARRGWDVTVVGGHSEGMRSTLGADVRWLPGASPARAIGSALRVGHQDVCHTHMTFAEAVGIATRPAHRAPVVSTRHFAAPRGASRLGRILAPRIAARIAREIAVSEFVAQRLERPPNAVISGGVPSSPCLWRPANRVVLVLQRLEPEKGTLTALHAWQLSGLADDGWTLRIVGDGSQRPVLERENIESVTFTGWTADVGAELEAAGIFLASAPAEPFGLGIVEAMAAGVPVAACAAGGHLETVGLLPDAALFAAGDTAAAAAALRSLLSDAARERASSEGRRLVAERFTIESHVDRVLAQYEAVR